MRRALAFALLAAGCSGGAAAGGRVFAPEWQNDAGKSIQAVYARVHTAPIAAGPGVAVGVTQQGLSGIGLDGSGKWTFAGEVDAAPALSGDVVVATTKGNVVALSAKTGKQLWRVSSEGKSLRGAGDDGKVTVVSLGEPGGGGSLLLAVSRSGSVLQKLAPEPEIGSPAVEGNVAFVPWGSQYVSAIDLDSGKEIGRLLLREQVSHAVNIDGQLYFGELSLVRFDDKIGNAAQNGATSISLPARELPGKPAWFDDGATVEPAAATARERIRLYATPGEGGISGDVFAATYFKVAMGLGAKDAKLHWVKTTGKDVVGGAAMRGGFALCTESGKVLLVGDNGGDAGSVDLGGPLLGCVVRGGAFAVSGAKDPPPLADQIAQAVELPEAQMVVAQRFLLRELGAMEDPKVTKVLIDLAENARTPPMLLEDARKLLASRRNGADYMIAALAKHYDFLSDVLRPPPVGPMADALAAMDDKRAAPLLARHLNDPANTPDDIQRAARALEKLATPAQVEDLKTFFALYRATADRPELVSAVLSVARALMRVGGEEAKSMVARAASDPLTHPDIKAGLAALVPAQKPAAKPG
ncbi:MAG: PQQ-binding-like beta-propeller repeat protein [Myxococcales bacterium]|nr:PQQ-binding-like beta-propeller repeat protein [Myxococcales bacterium]MCB9580464.1 PQQ-binding-like beta-propeller repeat protein [Polyangiaceae bacterium]